jgi:hypothetical protein
MSRAIHGKGSGDALIEFGLFNEGCGSLPLPSAGVREYPESSHPSLIMVKFTQLTSYTMT